MTQDICNRSVGSSHTLVLIVYIHICIIAPDLPPGLSPRTVYASIHWFGILFSVLFLVPGPSYDDDIPEDKATSWLIWIQKAI